jgi:ABC-type transporter Mla subunit MlaD
METLKYICMLIITAALTFVLVEAGLFERDARRALPQISTQARATLLDYSRLSQDATGVTAQLRATLKAVKDSNEQTARNAATSTATLNRDLEKLGKVIDGLSLTVVNFNLQTDELAQHANATLDDTQASIRTAQPAIDDLTRAAAGAAAVMNDPSIPATLASTATIAANTADTSHQLDMTAQDIHVFVHRETAPVKGTWNVIKAFLIEFAGPLAEVAAAAK